jgi:hypothetical protein
VGRAYFSVSGWASYFGLHTWAFWGLKNLLNKSGLRSGFSKY